MWLSRGMTTIKQLQNIAAVDVTAAYSDQTQALLLYTYCWNTIQVGIVFLSISQNKLYPRKIKIFFPVYFKQKYIEYFVFL